MDSPSILGYADEWLTPPAQCEHAFLHGQAVLHSLFHSSVAPDIQACCTLCNTYTTRRCRVWQWDNETHLCELSEAPGPPVFRPGIVSGVSLRSRSFPTRTAPLPEPKPPLGFKPNFVLFLTDDQDRILGREGYDTMGSLAAMPQLQLRLINEGAFVEHFYVNTPICCPSRTELLTGRYFHNVGPPRRPGSCMHVDTSVASSNETGLFGLLTRAGYSVGVFGKVTNDQERVLSELVASNSVDAIDSPLNYNDYDGLPYFRYDRLNGARVETLSADAPKFGTTYQTSQIGNRTTRWLRGAMAVTTAHGRPFFAYVGPHAPHFPAEPAPWHRSTFAELRAPITPNYNLSSPGKAQHVRQNPPLSPGVLCWQSAHFRDRWASLLAVDDLVGEVLDLLARDLTILKKSYVLYTSDHGYKLGQWRIGTSKQHPYETDIHVPFLIRGPGVPAGANLSSNLAGNVDILPTILELAAGDAFVSAVSPDGRSMLSFLITYYGNLSHSATLEQSAPTRPWRTTFLNEYVSVGTYFNDHAPCWEPADKRTTRLCGGPMPRTPSTPAASDERPNASSSPFEARSNRALAAMPPTQPPQCVEAEGTGDGNCYFIDSLHSNSWRQLRMINLTHNLNYVEYDHAWRFDPDIGAAGHFQHYELYDIARDPFQMDNLYLNASASQRSELHALLGKYFLCSGETCP